MNERIKLLWDQAEKEIQAEYEDESRRNRRLYNEIFLPKFAELIVQECTNFLKDTMDDHFAAEQLEEHFGVKE